MAQDQPAQKVSTLLTIQKFDHEQEGPPRLFEQITTKDGVVIRKEVFGPAPEEMTT